MIDLLKELRRRNIFRVAAAYLVACWVVMQVVAVIGSAAGLPEWADSLALIILLAFGPVVLFIAWAFELTPDGIKTTQPETSPSSGLSLGGSDYVLIALLVGVFAVTAYQISTRPGGGSGQVEQAANEPSSAQLDNVASSSPSINQPTNSDVLAASIAVLPFADLSPDQDQAYFAEGISEELLNVLAGIDQLRVASRTSAFAYKNTLKRIPEIGSELNVRHVLEGSVRKSGDTIRVTAQLIDAQTDEHLWSNTYDETLSVDSIFRIQDQISQAIVEALRPVLDLEDDGVVLEVQPLTENLSAYDLFLEARSLFHDRSNIPLIVEMLQQAVTIDPDFIAAWELLGASAAIMPGRNFSLEYYDIALDAAQRVLAQRPDSSLANATIGLFHLAYDDTRRKPDWQAAEAAFSRALDSERIDASVYVWRSFMWMNLGYRERALRDAYACLEWEPDYLYCQEHLIRVLVGNGRDEDSLDAAIDYIERGGDLNVAFAAQFAATGERGMAALTLRAMGSPAGFPLGSIIDDLSSRSSRPDPEIEAFLLELDQGTDGGGRGTRLRADMIAVDGVEIRGGFPPFNPFWGSSNLIGQRDEEFRVFLRYYGIVDYWRENGFPPDCQPVGDTDFRCEW